MYRSALRYCVWDSSKDCRWAYIRPLDSCLVTCPLKPSYAGEPSHIPLREIDGWTCFIVELCQPLVRPEGEEFALRSNLLPPSMKRVAFQLFLTRSDMTSFSTSTVSFEATS